MAAPDPSESRNCLPLQRVASGVETSETLLFKMQKELKARAQGQSTEDSGPQLQKGSLSCQLLMPIPTPGRHAALCHLVKSVVLGEGRM